MQERPGASRAFHMPLACTLGVLRCLMLLYWNWYDWTLIAWTVIGIAIYFGYGYRHSKLRAGKTPQTTVSSTP